MSYILEALKKSQQERDIGQVPTLETSPAMAEAGRSGINYWGISAVLLAGLAVVIALYAAMRGFPGTGDSASEPAVAGPPASVKVPALPDSMPAELKEQAEESVPPGGGVGEPPPSAVRVAPKEEAAPARTAPSRSIQPAPLPERAPAIARPGRPSSPPEAGRRKDGKVPEDLRHEIEEFKQRVRQEQSGKAKESGTDVSPKKLRLPREVKERLPSYLMTVHIFDADPSKRFVLVNARKLREGERTRDDIVVEEILPDGVVLSYEGHRFFQRR